jgi:hypothetical protein
MKDYRNLGCKVLRDDIRSDFEPYWSVLDRAHREDHFLSVEHTGRVLVGRLQLDIDPLLVTLVAYFHDLFTWSRKNHHLLSREFIRTTGHATVSWLSSRERFEVAEACGQHRASYTGRFSCLLAEVMNAADRCLPNLHEVFQRSIIYGTSRGLSQGDATREAVKHLKEKFGRGGYARYPSLYVEAFGKELEDFYTGIDKLYEDTFG